MKLDKYEKASLDILKLLRQDPTVFIINALYFRTVVAIAQHNNIHAFDHSSYEYISILDMIPKIYEEIELALPYPTQNELTTPNHFVTELIAQYGESWIPTASLDYKKAQTISFCEDITMVSWQRYLRAKWSKDRRELTVLSVDPVLNIREVALSKLKTIDESL